MFFKKNFLWFLFLFINVSPAWLSATTLPTAVSTNVCADELLLEVASPEQILGVTYYTKPRYENILNASSIHLHRGQNEEILALKPDLILTGAFDAPTTKKLYAQFQIETLPFAVAKDFNEIMHQIKLLGEKLNRQEKAQEIILKMQERLRETPSKDIKGKKAVFWGYEGHIPGKNTYEDALLKMLGLRNIAEDFHIEGHGWISLEKMIQAQPDFLIVSKNADANDAVGSDLLTHPVIRQALPDLKIITLEENSLRCGGPYLAKVLTELKTAIEKA